MFFKGKKSLRHRLIFFYVLPGQILVEKVKTFPSMLYDRALDSERLASYMMEVVGTTKILDEEVVAVFLKRYCK